MYWKNKRVLVTGGAGQIGSHLVARLAAAGLRQHGIGTAASGDLNEEGPALSFHGHAGDAACIAGDA